MSTYQKVSILLCVKIFHINKNLQGCLIVVKHIDIYEEKKLWMKRKLEFNKINEFYCALWYLKRILLIKYNLH